MRGETICSYHIRLAIDLRNSTSEYYKSIHEAFISDIQSACHRDRSVVGGYCRLYGLSRTAHVSRKDIAEERDKLG